MWGRLWEVFGFQNVKGIWAQIFWCVSMDHVGAFVKAFLTNTSQAYCAAQRSVNSPVQTEIPLQRSMLFVRLHGSKITLSWDVIRIKKGRERVVERCEWRFFFAETFEADISMLILPMEIVVVANCSTFFSSKFPSTFLHELLKSEFCKTVGSRLHRQIFIGQRNEHRN